MRKGQALAILREELNRHGWPTDYDFTVKDEPLEDGADPAWWRVTDSGEGETARNRAYLAAYVRIANDDRPPCFGDRLRARGLRLQPKGRLWMDRYVIGKMVARGFLDFEAKPDGLYEPRIRAHGCGPLLAAGLRITSIGLPSMGAGGRRAERRRRVRHGASPVRTATRRSSGR